MTRSELEKWARMIKETKEQLKNLPPEEMKKLQEDLDNDKRNYSLPEGLELILPDSFK